MSLLAAKEISRQFDAEPVFSKLTFEVRKGERIGLVGPNGGGKSTLLNILVGQDEPDCGKIERHPSLRIELLEQEPVISSEKTLLEESKSGLAHLYELQNDAEWIAQKVAGETDPHQLEKLHRQYDSLQETLHRQKAYQIDHRVDRVLQGLGFATDDYEKPLNQFSGGQQNRAMLCKLLLQAPDILMLDEPTNHLDIEATEWLESYLTVCENSFIIVSHDRYFLDRVTNRIFELHRGKLSDYKGNFSAYWKQRDERKNIIARTHSKQQDFIAKTEDFIRKNKYGQKHTQASDREKKLGRIQKIELLDNFDSLSMNFGEPPHCGEWVIEAKNVSKGFGTPLFEKFTYRVDRGDRLGILGPNGSGKTTLLRTLIGDLQADAGSLRYGSGVKIVYFDQQLETVDRKLDAIEAVRPSDRPEITPGVIRSLLARFGLKGEIVFQPVGSMSGGEKSKVALTKLSIENGNVLVLDEPTNHLDLWSRDSLERALCDFSGTVLISSHDRYFLNRVCKSVIVLEAARWRDYAGNYDDYLHFTKRRNEEEKNEVPADSIVKMKQDLAKLKKTLQNDDPQIDKKKRKFPYRKVYDIEEEIAENEELFERLQSDLGNPEILRDEQRTRETREAYEDIREQLANLYQHWEEASELN